ncbi:hypothetical protein [Edaphobacter bradus]|uniref:hypothetical protein n=1 Tax=Edaphobacter bradus TaxID=2259016 RepID=UPI0021DFB47F|nr:hypothetical protein [Edaphobacter bradus]
MLSSALLVLPAPAQVTRVSAVKPRPLFTGLLSLSASPSAVNFSLVSGGVAQGSSPIAVSTSWFIAFNSTVNVYAYFTSSTAALSGSSPVVNIPSSNVLGKDTTGIPTSFTAFTQSNPLGGAGASLQLSTTSVPLGIFGSHTDNLSLEIDLTSLPQLPAATYTGVLMVQAQAF